MVKEKDWVGCCFGEYGQLEILEKTNIKQKKKDTLYRYICNICKNDPELFGDAIYISRLDHLKNNISGCGCSNHTNWTQAQQQIRIQRVCNLNNYTFLGFCSSDEWKYSYTRFSVECEKGHIWQPTINTFLNSKTGCPNCAISGFKNSEPTFIYVVKISGKETATGYGITANSSKRLKEHKVNLSKIGCYIEEVETFLAQGKQALDIETSIKNIFERKSLNVTGFRKESTYYHNYEDVLSFIKDRLVNSKTENCSHKYKCTHCGDFLNDNLCNILQHN